MTADEMRTLARRWLVRADHETDDETVMALTEAAVSLASLADEADQHGWRQAS